MAANNTLKNSSKTLIEEGLFKSSIPLRNRRNNLWTRLYMLCVALAACGAGHPPRQDYRRLVWIYRYRRCG